MNEHKYRISLCIKRSNDRFLGVKEAPSYGTRALGGNMLYHWLPEGESYPLDLTKEEAHEIIEKILAAKMPDNVHDFDTWSILKMQACLDTTCYQPDEDYEWKMDEHLHPVYIGLHRTDIGCDESQWELQLNQSQVRGY